MRCCYQETCVLECVIYHSHAAYTLTHTHTHGVPASSQGTVLRRWRRSPAELVRRRGLKVNFIPVILPKLRTLNRVMRGCKENFEGILAA